MILSSGTDAVSRADVSAASLGAKPRKPKSMWAVQTAGAVLLILVLVGFIRLCLFAASNKGWLWSELIVSAGWRLVGAVALLAMLRDVQRRTRLGKMLGLAFITLVFAWFAYVGMWPQRAPSYAPAYSNPALGANVEAAMSLLVVCLTGWWFYAFGFSKASRAYFGR